MRKDANKIFKITVIGRMAVNNHFEDVYSNEELEILKAEFSRLNGVVYLDHTGSTLYADSQIREIFEDLRNNTYGNPHSSSVCSKIVKDTIDLARIRVLDHFHTSCDEYSVVFTSGATSAVKLLAESFDFTGTREPNEIDNEDKSSLSGVRDHKNSSSESCSRYNSGIFAYLMDNHTSVIGMRETAINHGALMRCITVPEFKKYFDKGSFNSSSTRVTKNSLFSYPAQCNFSGAKYPMTWIEAVKKGILNSIDQDNQSNWFCLLDAATFVSTNDLDLSRFKPDFVCISFYKIFGYPTGLGALLIKNSSSHVLKKKYFGGGSVSISLSRERFHIPKPSLERFEDGTLPFLSILSVMYGFKTIYRLVGSMSKVKLHTFNLSKYFYQNLKMIQHYNGQPVAKVYCDTNYDNEETQGNIVNFNLLRSNGSYVGYTEVLQMANLHNIQLRTGCFCNPGACQRHLGLTDQQLLDNYEAGHVCGDTVDLLNGRPTGSVRISFGYMSTKNDADALLSMIESCFVERNDEALAVLRMDILKEDVSSNKGQECKSQPPNMTNGNFRESNSVEKYSKSIISHIFLYPIKSCAAFQVERWPLGPRGLLYDRQWMIVNSAGLAITQKKETRLCMIQPYIDIKNKKFHINYPGMPEIIIPLNVDDGNIKTDSHHSKVCGDKVQAIDCGDLVANWLTTAFHDTNLGKLRLYCQSFNDDRKFRLRSKNKGKIQGKELSLSNQAQFLLINSASIRWLSEQICVKKEVQTCKESDLRDRFRANFVVECPEAFLEKEWNQIKIGKISFQSEGPCTRCQMICIDQKTGDKSKEPLSTITRMLNGKCEFGIYLSRVYSESKQEVSVGDEVQGIEKH